jgi:uncharacterized protein
VIGVTADTNIYISALVFGGVPLQLITAARHRMIRFDISEPLLDETTRVLRDKFLWSEDMLERAANRLFRCTSLVRATETIDAVPEDPDDNRVLECAVTAGSQYVVTGDSDLLRLGSFRTIRILRVADFLALIAGPRS